MIRQEEELLNEAVKAASALLAGAVRTAPKSRGRNTLKTALVTGEEKARLAQAMKKYERPAFQRDAQNILDADAVLLAGVRTVYLGLDCGWCRNRNCKESEEKNGLCIFNLVDLGVALGSAVSKAADLRVDNRIMYTAGYAARDLGFLPGEYGIIMAVPLKYSHKSIFFDRKA